MRHWLKVTGLALLLIGGANAGAQQVRTIDPNQAIDGDLSSRPATPRYQEPAERAPATDPQYSGDPVAAGPQDPYPADRPVDGGRYPNGQYPNEPAPAPVAENRATSTTEAATTYKRGDVFNAGERVFGKGAQGLAEILEKILKDQGEPSAYIAGREAGGAALVGLRYGSGILSHRVEGDLPVYWTGPSLGFDLGGSASKVFVLVYNLYDTQDIYRRFPEGEGHLYFVGGFSATYLRRGNIVLIPVRLGVGLRAGVNVGYMKIRKKQHWLPF